MSHLSEHLSANEVKAIRFFVERLLTEFGQDVTDVRLRGIINVDAGQETGILVFVFTARALGRGVIPSHEGTLEWIKQDQVTTVDLVEDLPQLLPRVLAMQPDEQPFFARYHYDEQDKLIITFAENCAIW